MTTRFEDNQKIVAILLNYLAVNPDIRLGQALRNLRIVVEDSSGERDSFGVPLWSNGFSEEPRETLARVLAQAEAMGLQVSTPDVRFGYMCETDFFHELGEVPTCAVGAREKDVDHGSCGIVRVKVECVEVIRERKDEVMDAEDSDPAEIDQV